MKSKNHFCIAKLLIQFNKSTKSAISFNHTISIDLVIKMKISLHFLFALMAAFSTLHARTTTCHMKVNGVVVPTILPRICCNRKGRINYMKVKLKWRPIKECDPFVCPLFALKGCDFMCQWYRCRAHYGGADGCRKVCKKLTAMPTSTTTSPKPTTKPPNNLCPVLTAIFGCRFVCNNHKVIQCRNLYGGSNDCMDQCRNKPTAASTKPPRSTTKPPVSLATKPN